MRKIEIVEHVINNTTIISSKFIKFLYFYFDSI